MLFLRDISASVSGLLSLLRRAMPTSCETALCSSVLFFFSTAVLSLYFVCVFKAGPWTDNYARVPKFFTGLSVNLGHLSPRAKWGLLPPLTSLLFPLLARVGCMFSPASISYRPESSGASSSRSGTALRLAWVALYPALRVFFFFLYFAFVCFQRAWETKNDVFEALKNNTDLE